MFCPNNRVLSKKVTSPTPGEEWIVEREKGGHYCLETDFAHKVLGKKPGKILIVGSPIFEAIEFSEAGWDVTYVDVRKPPPLKFRVLQGDICTIELEPASFDAVSSTCVLCHVGMGRYGDPIVDDADEKALKNISSAMKLGAFAAITFGPIADLTCPGRVGLVHRVYNMRTIVHMCSLAGLSIVEFAILDGNNMKWLSKLPTLEQCSVIDRHLFSAKLIKHA